MTPHTPKNWINTVHYTYVHFIPCIRRDENFQKLPKVCSSMFERNFMEICFQKKGYYENFVLDINSEIERKLK